MIGQTVSHYEIEDKLGAGGMGVVYSAIDTVLGRRVAVKFLSNAASARPDYRSRFLREARAVSALSHSNIATVFDYGETDDGIPYIVMEFVNGRTLGELLANDELTIDASIEIVGQILAALGEAHTHGIVHRDIKPSNVIVTKNGQVKVLDFGLAKYTSGAERSSSGGDAETLLNTFTQSGIVVGTPLYLSPEQAVSSSVDGRSDLFAVGALLYECLAGRPAFAGTSLFEIGAQIIHVDPAPPSTFNERITPGLDYVVKRALTKQVDGRYQKATEFQKELNAARPSTASGDVPVKRADDFHGMRPSGAFGSIAVSLGRPRLSIMTVVLGAAILVVAVISIIYLSRKKIHQPPAAAVRWYQTGISAIDDGAFFQASKALEQAVTVDKSFALAHARLAEVLAELDYSDQARDELLQVSSLVPDQDILPEMDRLKLGAVTAIVRRDFPSAVRLYSSIAERTQNDSQALLDLGRALEKNDEIDKAIDSYTRATEADPECAPGYLRLGVLHGRKQEYAAANSDFDKSESIYQTLGNLEGVAEVQYQRGTLALKSGKVPEARSYLDKALSIALTTGNEYQQLKTLLQSSGVEVAANNGEQAEKLASQAVNLAQLKGMENLSTKGLVDLGNAYFVRADYANAEKYFRQALGFAAKTHSTSNQALAMVMLGSLNYQLNRPDDALTYAKQALELFQKGGYEKEASQALVIIGHANRLKGDYSAAMDAFNQQLQLAEKTGDKSQAATAHEALGALLEQKERYGDALEHYKRKYDLSKETGNQRGVGYGLMETGTVLWKLGKYEEGEATLEQARQQATQPAPNNGLLSDIELSLADMLVSKGKFTDARAKASDALRLAGAEAKDVTAHVNQINAIALLDTGGKREAISGANVGLRLATELGDPFLISRARLVLAEVLLDNGDFQGALDNANNARDEFTKNEQFESETRATVIAARAMTKLKTDAPAEAMFSSARDCLAKMKGAIGDQYSETYFERPDIQSLRNQK